MPTPNLNAERFSRLAERAYAMTFGHQSGNGNDGTRIYWIHLYDESGEYIGALMQDKFGQYYVFVD